jgi:hypothetical protein
LACLAISIICPVCGRRCLWLVLQAQTMMKFLNFSLVATHRIMVSLRESRGVLLHKRLFLILLRLPSTNKSHPSTLPKITSQTTKMNASTPSSSKQTTQNPTTMKISPTTTLPPSQIFKKTAIFSSQPRKPYNLENTVRRRTRTRALTSVEKPVMVKTLRLTRMKVPRKLFKHVSHSGIVNRVSG